MKRLQTFRELQLLNGSPKIGQSVQSDCLFKCCVNAGTSLCWQIGQNKLFCWQIARACGLCRQNALKCSGFVDISTQSRDFYWQIAGMACFCQQTTASRNASVPELAARAFAALELAAWVFDDLELPENCLFSAKLPTTASKNWLFRQLLAWRHRYLPKNSHFWQSRQQRPQKIDFFGNFQFIEVLLYRLWWFKRRLKMLKKSFCDRSEGMAKTILFYPILLISIHRFYSLSTFLIHRFYSFLANS